jgi:hypothetical protein
MSDVIIGQLEPVIKLTRDIRNAIRDGGPGGVTASEARFLVDMYYTMQKQRIRINNQVKGLERDAKKMGNEPEPHDVLVWALKNMETIEAQIKAALGIYVEVHPMHWFFAQTRGIGPVLGAGLLAHIDIHRAPTVGHIWNFAGLNPDVAWEKGKKRPFNGQLKTLCWKIGDSFVKLSNPDNGSYYGLKYRARKEYELRRNESGALADQAQAKLDRFKIGKSTDAYKAYSAGTLPPAHLDMRARRWTVKLFLSHLHQRWYEQEIGPVPKPFAIAHQGHAHYIEPPQVPPTETTH